LLIVWGAVNNFSEDFTMVYMLLADGFEEIETIAPLDILRRADIDVSTVSLTDDLLVQGGHGIIVKADMTLAQVDYATLEMLVLPGGGGGVPVIAKTPDAMDLIKRVCEDGKMLAAICAAPSLLAALGFLNGRRVVCYPTLSDVIKAAGGNFQHELSVACDGNLITGKAAGASIDFGLALVAALRGNDVSEQVRCAIYY
jgi:4-methyl-5(b-hydroxyethyl)-thiazole monophosphate biosynthesis